MSGYREMDGSITELVRITDHDLVGEKIMGIHMNFSNGQNYLQFSGVEEGSKSR